MHIKMCTLFFLFIFNSIIDIIYFNMYNSKYYIKKRRNKMNRVRLQKKKVNRGEKSVIPKYRKLSEKYNIPYEKLKRIVQPSQKTAKTSNIALAKAIEREFPGIYAVDVLTHKAIVEMCKEKKVDT